MLSEVVGSAYGEAGAELGEAVRQAGGVALLGIKRLAAAPLVAVREETELAMKGDAPEVTSPGRWTELEQLVHSINRAITRR